MVFAIFEMATLIAVGVTTISGSILSAVCHDRVLAHNTWELIILLTLLLSCVVTCLVNVTSTFVIYPVIVALGSEILICAYYMESMLHRLIVRGKNV
jgi:hypothetical protein